MIQALLPSTSILKTTAAVAKVKMAPVGFQQLQSLLDVCIGTELFRHIT